MSGGAQASKRKNLPKHSDQNLRVLLEKKKKCNAKAQAIVERLLEPIQSDELLNVLADINQSHLDDVFTERAIVNHCGWPLCPNKLEEVPKQQFKINLAVSKVYDITERKKFCSSQCYKSGNYLKEQLLTSPLWLRDAEIIPEFKLLSIN